MRFLIVLLALCYASDAGSTENVFPNEVLPTSSALGSRCMQFHHIIEKTAGCLAEACRREKAAQYLRSQLHAEIKRVCGTTSYFLEDSAFLLDCRFKSGISTLETMPHDLKTIYRNFNGFLSRETVLDNCSNEYKAVYQKIRSDFRREFEEFKRGAELFMQEIDSTKKACISDAYQEAQNYRELDEKIATIRNELEDLCTNFNYTQFYQFEEDPHDASQHQINILSSSLKVSTIEAEFRSLESDFSLFLERNKTFNQKDVELEAKLFEISTEISEAVTKNQDLMESSCEQLDVIFAKKNSCEAEREHYESPVQEFLDGREHVMRLRDSALQKLILDTSLEEPHFSAPEPTRFLRLTERAKSILNSFETSPTVESSHRFAESMDRSGDRAALFNYDEVADRVKEMAHSEALLAIDDLKRFREETIFESSRLLSEQGLVTRRYIKDKADYEELLKKVEDEKDVTVWKYFGVAANSISSYNVSSLSDSYKNETRQICEMIDALTRYLKNLDFNYEQEFEGISKKIEDRERAGRKARDYIDRLSEYCEEKDTIDHQQEFEDKYNGLEDSEKSGRKACDYIDRLSEDFFEEEEHIVKRELSDI